MGEGVCIRVKNIWEVLVRGRHVGARGFEVMRKGVSYWDFSMVGDVRGKRISSSRIELRLRTLKILSESVRSSMQQCWSEPY